MNEAEAKSRGKVYAPQLTSNRTGRNELCPCGSGRKYKKCCLIKEQERNRIMQEVKDKLGKDVPSQEEAVRLLRGYTNQRIIQHNATVQVLHNITQCLEALPPSEKRDFVKADFERRLNELVGDGKGREAQVTQTLVELIATYPEVQTEGQEVAESEAEALGVPDDEAKEAEANAEVSDELENDAQAEQVGDGTIENEIDEIVEDEAATA